MEILGRRILGRHSNSRRRRPRPGYALGNNEGGDPYANMDNHFAPGLVAGLKNIRYIACGNNYSLAVTKPNSWTKKESCYVWGQNDDGQTTLPSNKNVVVAAPHHPDAPDGQSAQVVLYPTEAPWLSGLGHVQTDPESAIKTISGSLRYALAIRRNGWGEVWGNEHEMPYAMGIVSADGGEDEPELPLGNDLLRAPPFAANGYYDPESLFGGGRRWQLIATGLKHTLAVDQDGGVWVVGDNEVGQLGMSRQPMGHTTMFTPLPLKDWLDNTSEGLQVLTDRRAIFVGAGARYSVIGLSKTPIQYDERNIKKQKFSAEEKEAMKKGHSDENENVEMGPYSDQIEGIEMGSD